MKTFALLSLLAVSLNVFATTEAKESASSCETEKKEETVEQPKEEASK